MTDTMIATTLEHLEKDAQASAILMDAATEISKAMLLNREADLASGGSEAQAFITESLEHLVRRQGLTLRSRSLERARQLGWQVASYEIAPLAKDSGTEAVVFITGNNYMPPLRAFGISDQVFQLDPGHASYDSGEVWEAYAEAIESRLDELRVYMACPDYDNALYVVDLERFEHNEDADGDSLEDGWKPLEQG